MNGSPLVYRAPAKVNLILEVLGKRPDGYHELALVFQALSLRTNWNSGRLKRMSP